jgi:hypothetical protein
MRLYQKQFAVVFEQTKKTKEMTDLSEVIDHETLVMALPAAAKLVLAEPILDLLDQRSWWFQFMSLELAKLEDEVSNGQCILVFKENGAPVRAAIVVATRVKHPLGMMLAKVAEVKDLGISVTVRLPGHKLRDRESLGDAARRVVCDVEKDLGISGYTLLEETVGEITVSEVPSASYGDLITRYTRHIFDSRIEDTLDIAEAPPVIDVQQIQQFHLNQGHHRGMSRLFSSMSEATSAFSRVYLPPSPELSKSEPTRQSSPNTVDSTTGPPTSLKRGGTGLNLHIAGVAEQVIGVMNDVVHSKKKPNLRGGRTILNAETDAAILTAMPWLQQHIANHVHLAVNDEGSGAIYAWMWPTDFENIEKALTYNKQ